MQPVKQSQGRVPYPTLPRQSAGQTVHADCLNHTWAGLNAQMTSTPTPQWIRHACKTHFQTSLIKKCSTQNERRARREATRLHAVLHWTCMKGACTRPSTKRLQCSPAALDLHGAALNGAVGQGGLRDFHRSDQPRKEAGRDLRVQLGAPLGVREGPAEPGWHPGEASNHRLALLRR